MAKALDFNPDERIHLFSEVNIIPSRCVLFQPIKKTCFSDCSEALICNYNLFLFITSYTYFYDLYNVIVILYTMQTLQKSSFITLRSVSLSLASEHIEKAFVFKTNLALTIRSVIYLFHNLVTWLECANSL